MDHNVKKVDVEAPIKVDPDNGIFWGKLWAFPLLRDETFLEKP